MDQALELLIYKEHIAVLHQRMNKISSQLYEIQVLLGQKMKKEEMKRDKVRSVEKVANKPQADALTSSSRVYRAEPLAKEFRRNEILRKIERLKIGCDHCLLKRLTTRSDSSK